MLSCSVSSIMWSHSGFNLGPPDYESGATPQLSYETDSIFNDGMLFILLQ